MDAVFIILAGGQGSRFGARTPKQFLRLKRKPILYWSLANLQKARSFISHVVLALPHGWNLEKLKAIGAIPRGFPWRLIVVEGGRTRSESLANALAALAPQLLENAALFVHDAARPAWPASWIKQMLSVLKRNKKAGGVIPLLAVRETIKRVNGTIKTIADRDRLYVSQTPQLARGRNFLKALRRLRGRKIWDEAQALELAGDRLLPFPGDPANIKITFREDLTAMEKAWKK